MALENILRVGAGIGTGLAIGTATYFSGNPYVCVPASVSLSFLCGYSIADGLIFTFKNKNEKDEYKTQKRS